MKNNKKLYDNTNGFHLSQSRGRSATGKRHTRGLNANQVRVKKRYIDGVFEKSGLSSPIVYNTKPLNLLNLLIIE